MISSSQLMIIWTNVWSTMHIYCHIKKSIIMMMSQYAWPVPHETRGHRVRGCSAQLELYGNLCVYKEVRTVCEDVVIYILCAHAHTHTHIVTIVGICPLLINYNKNCLFMHNKQCVRVLVYLKFRHKLDAKHNIERVQICVCLLFSSVRARASKSGKTRIGDMLACM